MKLQWQVSRPLLKGHAVNAGQTSPVPALEQMRHLLSVMPAESAIEQT